MGYLGDGFLLDLELFTPFEDQPVEVSASFCLGVSPVFSAEVESIKITVTAGLSVVFEADTPDRDISPGVALSVIMDGEKIDYRTTEAVGVSALFDAVLLAGDLAGEIGLSGEAEAEAEYNTGATAAIEMSVTMEGGSLDASLQGVIEAAALFQRGIEAPRGIEDVAGLSSFFEGFNWTDFLRFYGDHAIKRYFFSLTGIENGLDDAVIPFSSFQTRIRNQEPTYLSVVVPGMDYADAIVARPDGQIVIDMAYFFSGEEMHREEIVRADLETIDIHEGGTSKSIVLTGHKTIDWGGAKTVNLSGVTYRRTTNGTTRLRTAIPDLYLKPGDYVSYDDNTIQVEQISIFVGPAYGMMEIAGQ